MVKKDWLSFVLVGVLVLIIGVGLVAKAVIGAQIKGEVSAKFPDNGAPRINITLNGVTLEEINSGSKEIKYEGNKVKLYEGENVLGFDNVRVKGRGNGTWVQKKKPYQIRFSEKIDLFGLGKARKWVLLANAMDATNLRTKTAFYLEDLLGMKYKFEGRFVELYIDEEYEGLYYLTHAVEIGKSVVDLRDPMGVLVELDNLYYWEEDYRESRNGDYLVLKDAVDEGNGEVAMREFVSKYDEFERAVAERNYERVGELVDVESFAQYYLLSEFSVNPDAYWTSFYMYKDGVEDKIHAGPGWDFDLAFANGWWGNWMGEEFYSPEQTMIRRGELLAQKEYEEMNMGGEIDWYTWSQKLSRIMFDMMEMPEFREEVVRQYREKMQGRVEELVVMIPEWASGIEVPMREDYQKWDKGDYRKEIDDMVEWIKRRAEFFEKEYGVYKADI